MQHILGVRQCPTGSNNTEMEHFKEVAMLWKEEVRTGCLDRRHAWDDIMLRVMKTLEYLFPVTTFSEPEYRQILWPVLEGGYQPLEYVGICTEMSYMLPYATRT